MVESASKLPSHISKAPDSDKAPVWRPFDSLHREIDRLFDDFGRGFWRAPFRSPMFDAEPFWRRDSSLTTPAVDIVDKGEAYQIAADLPGLDEKNIDIQLVNGNLTIKGEKSEEKQEKQENYMLQERRFGSFQRTFTVPQDVVTDKIQAKFEKGVLTVTLPKKPEATQPAKKIDVKAG